MYRHAFPSDLTETGWYTAGAHFLQETLICMAGLRANGGSFKRLPVAGGTLHVCYETEYMYVQGKIYQLAPVSPKVKFKSF